MNNLYSQYLYVWNETQVTDEPREKYREVLLEEDTDEELEEKYANIDVNFDESETEEGPLFSPCCHSESLNDTVVSQART